MRRFFLFLFCFSAMISPLWGQVPNTQSEEASVTPLKENTSFISTGDNLKRLEAKRIEILSTLRLEKERVLEEVKRRDEIQVLLSEIDVLLRESAKLTLQKNVLQDDEKIQETDSQLQEKQALATEKILLLATRLDFASYTSDTPFSELQKDF